MVRLVASAIAMGLAGLAPLQCAREPEPEERRYETPPEALYDLSERFRRQGDTRAERATLKYLLERYPNSRFAHRAKLRLKALEP